MISLLFILECLDPVVVTYSSKRMVMWSKEDGSYLNEMEFDSELRNACYNGNEVCIIGKIKQ